MLQPIHTPLPGGDRITALAAHLEVAFTPSLALTALAVRRGREVEAVVFVYLADGGREAVSSDEARTLAQAVRGAGRDDWAESLEGAAASADRQASAVSAGMDVGAYTGVAAPRDFRGAR